MAEPSGLIKETVQRLEQKMGAQAELYRILLDLTEKQADQISAENMDALSVILEKKSRLVEEIGEIEQAAVPLKQFWEAHREDVDEESRSKLRSSVNEIRVLLERLVELESRSQRQLGLAKETIGEQIRQASVGREAVRSYEAHSESSPRFMDRRG